MFAKLKKKIEETDGSPGNRSFGSPGPGVASPVSRNSPGMLLASLSISDSVEQENTMQLHVGLMYLFFFFFSKNIFE